MKEETKSKAAGQLRHLLTSLGGFFLARALANKGLPTDLAPGLIEGVLGGGAVVAGSVWSWIAKRRKG